jgi:hypothetical protein
MYKGMAGLPYTYAVLRRVWLSCCTSLLLLTLPLETLAQDPALLNCIEGEVARGTHPDTALQLCNEKLSSSPS